MKRYSTSNNKESEVKKKNLVEKRYSLLSMSQLQNGDGIYPFVPITNEKQEKQGDHILFIQS